ncbi:hypothetical protein TRP8649_00904 [Pelagimonas phthalicica]|uniref:Uncharacterized protein n=1 Tax=Pelagimonas phthalicica TaxID=1037362 RepID=A0A238JA38_9RHOB|nr:DUF2793 domain-containing protein [Pelagimonas phthalicica]TDS94660.1 uncharacterized protein DUF2793 [Pelagimonas phthalicica]SMX26812.1 hypothetical protein TRP8649_00904 [Pelagimonas phthalicica]
MPQSSPIMNLPYIEPSQAQKHVTHNEALRILDAVTQLSVQSADLATPPASPADGDRYIVAAGGVADWAGQDGNIAVWTDNTWQFFAPQAGWRADVTPTGNSLRFDGTTWGPASDVSVVPQIGVNATADTVNRLAVASEASLFSHNGAGHQVKVNKDTATDTASLLFQTGWSGRAEMGTAGSDDFSIKVSADGTTFHTALQAEAATGRVALGQGAAHDELFTVAENAISPTILIRNLGGTGGAQFQAIDDLSGANWKFKTTGAGAFKLRDQTNLTDRLQLFPGVEGRIEFSGPVVAPSYTVATVPSAATATAGAMIFVSDEVGGAVLAFSDGTNWLRATDRAVIS